MDKGTPYKYKPTDMVIHLYMFLDTIDCNLKLFRFPNQNGRWLAEIENGEIKEPGVLVGKFGTGQTPEEAIEDYVQKIKGQTLVVNATTKYRKEFQIPQSLFYEP